MRLPLPTEVNEGQPKKQGENPLPAAAVLSKIRKMVSEGYPVSVIRSQQVALCLKRADSHHLVPTALKFVWHRFKRNCPRAAEIVHDTCDVSRAATVRGE